MARNVNKIKVNLTSAQKASIPSAAGALLTKLREFTDSAPKTAEGEIAFTDEDTSARYIRLQSKGLNILRSEIIAITEFIPVATGNDANPEANKMQYQLGDNKQVSVTNVARLIELHRQIREYVINAAEAVLSKMYPEIYVPEFLDQLKTVISNNFENLVEPTIEATISNIATVVKESTVGNISTIISNNANNPFLIATMEYFVYENLIDTIIRYLGQVAQIDETAAKNWSIENFHNLKTFSPQSAFKGIIKRIYESQGATSLSDTSDIARNVLGIHKNGSNSDTDMFVNTMSHLVSLISLKDSASVLSTVSNADISALEIEPGNVRYGISGDLADSIDTLKDIKLSDMVVGNIPRETKGYLGITGSSRLSMSKIKNIFTAIETANGDTVDDTSEGINELLAALSYDYVSFAVCKNNVVEKLSHLKGDTVGPTNRYVLKSYLKAALGAPRPAQGVARGAVLVPRQGIPNKANPANEKYFGIFGTTNAGIAIDDTKNEFGQTDRDAFYAPLESSKKETRENDDGGYLPGPKYFIENAILRSGAKDSGTINISFEDLEDFTKKYKKDSDHLLLDIMTLIPDTNIDRSDVGSKSAQTPGAFLGNSNNAISHLKYLNERLAKDVKKIIDEGTDTDSSLIPLVALFIADIPETERIKNFMSIFWGCVEKHGRHNEAQLRAVAQQFRVIASDGTRTQRDAYEIKNSQAEHALEAIASMVEYYSENAVHKFLKNTCGFDIRSGGMGKKSFHRFDGEFTTVLDATGNLCNNNGNQTQNKIPVDKPLNSSGQDIPRDTTIETRFSIKPERIDGVFDRTLGAGTGGRLKLIRDHRRSKEKRNFGLYRLMHRSLDAVLFGMDENITNALNKEYVWENKETNNYNAINQSVIRLFKPDSDSGVSLEDNPGVLGSICELEFHHRAILWIYYVYNLFRKTIQPHIKAGETGNLQFKINFDQFRGLRDALLDNRRPSTEGSARQYSYDAAKVIIDSLYNKVEVRQTKIRDTAALFSLHADALKETKNKATSVITGNSVKSSLAINTMISMGVYSDALTLNNDETPSLITQSFQKNYMSANNSLLPRDIFFNANKTKFMMKYMSEPGYGFLKNEKRGNKSVLHVGIPNSMISALQLNAFEETNDIRFLNSTYVCISVFKKSHIYPDYNFHPKNYIFDTSSNILDYNPSNNDISNHLKNFKGDASFDQLLKSIEISRIKVNEDGSLKARVSRGYGPAANSGMYSRDVLINHVTDYVLKEYNKLTTGLDFDEDTFLLLEQPIDFNRIQSTQLLGSKLTDEYVRILEMIAKLYPETEQDAQLKSEVFRLTRVIKQSGPFSFVNRFKKTVTPKSFDRVYSIIVNEKDFILSTAEDIFTQPVNFHINSKIQRPENLKDAYSANMNSEQSNYSKSISENYPEIYNYAVSLSLLPLEYEPGAILKPPYNSATSTIITSLTPTAVPAPSNINTSFRIT